MVTICLGLIPRGGGGGRHSEGNMLELETDMGRCILDCGMLKIIN